MNNPIVLGALVASVIFAFAIGYFVAAAISRKHHGRLTAICAATEQQTQKKARLENELAEIFHHVENAKQESALAVKRYQETKQKAETAMDSLKAKYREQKAAYDALNEATAKLQQLQADNEKITKEYENLSDKRAEIDALNAQYAELVSDISLYSELDQYIDSGLYPLPSYGELSAGTYAEQLKDNRVAQKALLKANQAYSYPEDIEITGDEKFDQRLAKNQGELLIRVFNSDCDHLIAKINSKNFEASLGRMEKLAEQLEKLLVSLEIGISHDYVALKMEEARIYYQYQCQKAAEAEEQREIRAQMREEAAAQREIEKALRDAEWEEQAIEAAMEKVRIEMLAANEAQRQAYQHQLDSLQARLLEAEAKGQRALSMAQQTKRGHVYIISNIGSFGEDIYKIGMTRRLEPMDRVNELGDASVPFPFDVHAMIFSENAPALEKELHDYFADASVNKINPRKEFFEVSISDIRNYLESKNIRTHWTLTADAAEYRQSLQKAQAA